jgi:hypothetical protein
MKFKWHCKAIYKLKQCYYEDMFRARTDQHNPNCKANNDYKLCGL